MNAKFIVAVVALASMLTACGRNFEMAGVTQTSGQAASTPGGAAPDVTTALSKAQAASTRAASAINDARLAIAGVSDSSGNIAMNMFSSIWSSLTGSSSSAPIAIDTSGAAIQVTSSGLLSPLVAKLAAAFNVVFEKVDDVDQNINSARLILVAAAAQLDPKDPQQALALGQINAQMASLDLMEKSFRAQLSTVAGKIDLAEDQLNKLVNFGTSFIPIPGLNIVAGMLIDTFLLNDVTNLLDAVKLKLLSV